MIRNGRYAIEIGCSGLISEDGPATNVPNDTYAADGKNFTVITGINGSGKVCFYKRYVHCFVTIHMNSWVSSIMFVLNFGRQPI